MMSHVLLAAAPAAACRPAAPGTAWRAPRRVGGAQAARQPLAARASRTGGPVVQPDEATIGRDFASSLALMVLGASLLSERLNGHGLVTQLQLDSHPLGFVLAASLAGLAVWPSKRKLATATDVVRDLAGRAAFGGLSVAVGAELWSNKGLLSLLEIETGVGVISEAEAVLAGLLLLVLTGPRKATTG